MNRDAGIVITKEMKRELNVPDIVDDNVIISNVII